MLTNMQIAVIGGDARQLEIIRKLIELDAKLSLIGFEQLDHAFSGATKDSTTLCCFFWYNKCLSNWDYRWCKQKISSTVQTG